MAPLRQGTGVVTINNSSDGLERVVQYGMANGNSDSISSSNDPGSRSTPSKIQPGFSRAAQISGSVQFQVAHGQAQLSRAMSRSFQELGRSVSIGDEHGRQFSPQYGAYGVEFRGAAGGDNP